MKPGSIVILSQKDNDLPAVSGDIAEGKELLKLRNDIIPGQMGKMTCKAVSAHLCSGKGIGKTNDEEMIIFLKSQLYVLQALVKGCVIMDPSFDDVSHQAAEKLVLAVINTLA